MLQICSARSPQIRLLTNAPFPTYTKKCVSLETSEQSFKCIFEKKKRSHVVVNIKAHKIWNVEMPRTQWVNIWIIVLKKTLHFFVYKNILVQKNWKIQKKAQRWQKMQIIYNPRIHHSSQIYSLAPGPMHPTEPADQVSVMKLMGVLIETGDILINSHSLQVQAGAQCR